MPLVRGESIIVQEFESESLVAIEDGQQLWRNAAVFSGSISGDSIIGSGKNGKFMEVDLATGATVREQDCEFGPALLLPGTPTFIGTKSSEEPGRTWLRVLALVNLETLRPVWSISSRGTSDEVFGFWHACADGALFVCKGSTLTAYELESGAERWSAPLGDFGGSLGQIQMMVSAHRVITSVAPQGVGAFDTATGKRLWTTQGCTPTVVYGGRAYSHRPFSFSVLDLGDGRVLLETMLEERIEKKWGFRDVVLSSKLAVSETHLFLGDGKGRLHAFDRETGEPVWYHRPRGGNPYFGNVPVIANNRLYVATAHRPDRPGSLYCYEEVPEGSWQPDEKPAAKRRRR